MRKKILLTGGSGMVGSNIVNNELANNYEILFPTSTELNLLDYQKIFDYLKLNKPEIIVHAAGIVGGIEANIKYPVKFLVENIQMGINILMASKKQNIKQFINLGSSCMYPKDSKNPISEDFILNGALEPTNEGYALSKIACAKLCEYISSQDNSFLYKTVIPCNLYGKYDNFNSESSHMIPGVIRKIFEAKNKSHKTVEIWGDGSVRREFMYAGDFANFIFYAIENFIKMPQNINVGIGKDYSIIEYYNIISDVIGFRGTFKYNFSKPTGMKQKLVDNKKLREFGWTNQTSLEEGIKSCFDHFIKINKK